MTNLVQEIPCINCCMVSLMVTDNKKKWSDWSSQEESNELAEIVKNPVLEHNKPFCYCKARKYNVARDDAQLHIANIIHRHLVTKGNI
jgi:hypothetical protein